MIDRYYIEPNTDDASWSVYWVLDRRQLASNREGHNMPVASCPDPDTAQRIADLLNADEMNKLLVSSVNDVLNSPLVKGTENQ